VLAGGLSRRMGLDKARLRIGGRSMLELSKCATIAAGLPVRVVRRDAVRRCGPIGGVVTALRTCRAGVALFLSCDMPFVSGATIRRVLAAVRRGAAAAFASDDGTAGFPFALRREVLGEVELRVARRAFSLQSLARALKARLVTVADSCELQNINSPRDLQLARSWFRRERMILRTRTALHIPPLSISRVWPMNTASATRSPRRTRRTGEKDAASNAST